jgi:hypothetical protein
VLVVANSPLSTGVYYLSQRDPTAPEGAPVTSTPNSRVTDASAPLDKTPLLIKVHASPHLTPQTRTAANSLANDSLVPGATLPYARQSASGRMVVPVVAGSRGSVRKSPVQHQQARVSTTGGRTRSRTDASDYLSQSARQRAAESGVQPDGGDDANWDQQGPISEGDEDIGRSPLTHGLHGVPDEYLFPAPLATERSDSGGEDPLSPRAAASEGIRSSFTSGRRRARSWSAAPSPRLIPQSLGRALAGMVEGPPEIMTHTPIFPLTVTLQALFEGGAQAEAEAAVHTTPGHHHRVSTRHSSRRPSHTIDHDPAASVPNPDRQRRSGTSAASTPPKPGSGEHKRSPSAGVISPSSSSSSGSGHTHAHHQHSQSYSGAFPPSITSSTAYALPPAASAAAVASTAATASPLVIAVPSMTTHAATTTTVVSSSSSASSTTPATTPSSSSSVSVTVSSSSSPST